MRTIRIYWADSLTAKVNKMMQRFDVGWDGYLDEDGNRTGEKNACTQSVITTDSTLPLAEYKLMVEKAFSEIDPGSEIYHIEEIVTV